MSIIINMNQLILKHHNPNLVDETKDPNDNTQILLFNDGEIVETKGGKSFLQHKFFVYAKYIPCYKEYSSIYKNNKKIDIEMPCNYINGMSYAILPSYDIAIKIRELMNK